MLLKTVCFLQRTLSKILIYPYQKEETSFVMPKEVTMYDEKETFQNPYLSEILVEEGNEKFSSYDGVIYNAEKTRLLTVPEGETENLCGRNSGIGQHCLKWKVQFEGDCSGRRCEGNSSICAEWLSGLTKIYIPKSVGEISEDAFFGVNMSGLTILGEKESAAEKFANAHGIRFVDVKEIEIKLEETKELIQKAREYDDTSVYTDESVETLRKAVEEAENIAAQSDVTVEQLNKAIENLNTAITNMEKRKEEPEKPDISEAIIAKKKEAKELLEKAKKYDNVFVYTEDSVQALRSAMKNMENVLNQEDVTLDRLEKAIDSLNDAVLGMKKKGEVEKPEKPNGQIPPKQEKPETPKTADTSAPALQEWA